MPLLSGYHKNTYYDSKQALYALENAFSSSPDDIKLKTEEFTDVSPNCFGVSLDPIGFTGWRLASLNTSHALYLLPPGHGPGVNNVCCEAFTNADYNYYNLHTNCLVAHDKNFNSVLIAFYNTKNSPLISGDIKLDTEDHGSYRAQVYYSSSQYVSSTYYKSVEPSIVFIAKDENDEIFGGGGCGNYGFPMITSFIGKTGGLNGLRAMATSPSGAIATIHDVYAYPPFYPHPNFNNKGILYLADMVNYTSGSLALAKSMKTGITVPNQPKDLTRFITCYEIGNRRFINFRNHGNPDFHIPLIDPWCPF